MLLAIAFFAFWMFLFNRFPAWPFFGIVSAVFLGLMFASAIRSAYTTGADLITELGYAVGYAIGWLVVGYAFVRMGRDRLARRRAEKTAATAAPNP